MAEQILTQALLKRLFRYEPETGYFFRLNWKSDAIAQRVAGLIAASGYVRLSIGKKAYQAHRLAWLYVHGVMPVGQIDHINRNKSDNRIENLRECNFEENQQNVVSWAHNTSGVRGVSWDKCTHKWRALICTKGKLRCLGRYANFEDAVSARKVAESKMFPFAPPR